MKGDKLGCFYFKKTANLYSDYRPWVNTGRTTRTSTFKRTTVTYVKVAPSDVRFETTPESVCVVGKASPFREQGHYIWRHVYVETIDHGGTYLSPSSNPLFRFLPWFGPLLSKVQRSSRGD